MKSALRSIAELSALRAPVHLAIGVFDGVHAGHRAVIERALASARESGGSACVVTFDPHPGSVLRPGNSPALLTSTRHKLRLLAALGVTHTLIIPFDAAFAATAPQDFIAQLAAACPLRQICVGENWAFGKGRAGNHALLRQLGTKLGFEAIGVPSVSVGGVAVSSTAIRAAIQNGDFSAARDLLGRDFSILGTVIEGNRLGHTLGFPTANLRPESEQLPPNGVYAVQATIAGKTRPSVANVGLRPTVEHAAKERLVEVHVLNFDDDLYGQDLEVHFQRFLRPEQKFPSLDALKTQIASDVRQAHQFFA